MQKLIIYNKEKIHSYLNIRKGETKFGERVTFLNKKEDLQTQLKNSKAKFVILGIPEDIGVQANFGEKGTRHAWEATLKVLLNTQHNKFNKANKCLILGHLDFTDELKKADQLDPNNEKDLGTLRNMVAEIDKEVVYYIQLIVAAGKKPIIIGGGHNNAYGIIKACALALNNAINCINFDAHTDFRKREGRHSGNGFSYAFTEGFLNRYFIFGLHENYTSKKIFNKLAENPEKIQYNTFEDIVTRQKTLKEQFNTALEFIQKKPFGIELDVDAIQNIPSSAMTPTGFSTNETRQFVSFFGNHKNALYLHLCEASPNPNDERETQQTGKLLSYLIIDFIRK